MPYAQIGYSCARRSGLVPSDFCPLGSKSMQRRPFQLLSWLLITWQLLLPSGAPWLHTLIDGSCCVDSCSVAKDGISTDCESTKTHHSHSGCLRSHGAGETSHSHLENELESEPNAPHDCSNCAVCQAIAAPRVVAAFVVLPVEIEQIEIFPIAECADPLLGFGLPLQCRAPPVA